MRYLLLSLLFVSGIYANLLEIEKMYEQKNYAQTIALAKASKKEYANPKLHLLWAKAAEKLARDKEAMSAYERVIMLDENNVEAHMALAKIYKKTKRYALAKEEVESLKHYALTPAQRTLLQQLLQETGSQTLKAQFDVALGYDTNVNISPGILEGYSGADTIASGFVKLRGSVSYIDELQENGGWYYRGDAQLLHTSNFESNASTYDLSYGVASTGFGYQTQKSGLNIYVPVEINGMHYLEKSLFYELKVEPKLYYKLNRAVLFNARARYVQRNYIQENDADRDDTSVGGGVGGYYFFDKNFIYGDVDFANYEPQKTLYASYVKRTYTTLSTGIYMLLQEKWNIRFDYRYRKGTYDDGNREDDYHNARMKFAYLFQEKYEVYLTGNYINNFSNVAGSQYDKTIGMLGMSVHY